MYYSQYLKWPLLYTPTYIVDSGVIYIILTSFGSPCTWQTIWSGGWVNFLPAPVLLHCLKDDIYRRHPHVKIRQGTLSQYQSIISILPSDTLFGDDLFCISYYHPNKETAMLSSKSNKWSFVSYFSKQLLNPWYFIGPRCPWGPIYGFECLKQTPRPCWDF